MSAPSTAVSARVRAPSGWLFGPATDLLLGCGLGSIAIMALQAALGASVARFAPGALLILLFAVPHYGATLVRTYEDPADRQKYRRFAAVAAIVVACSLVSSLYVPLVGSLTLTLYLTWSPWHYTGQNYGITLMLLGRRGVKVPPGTKRLLHASFVMSFALTFLAIHGELPQGAYAPVSYAGTIFRLLPIGIPHELVGYGIAMLGAGYIATVLTIAFLLARAGGLARIAPALLLMSTQALWFSLPVPIRYFDLAPADSVFRSVYTAYGFLWIAAYHSVQYLWITTYYATESLPTANRRAAFARRGRFLVKAVLLGYAIWTLPGLLFAPGLLGRLPQESGLTLMIAAMVNLHHFLLDGAIWKLRDGRIARILIDTRPLDKRPPDKRERRAESESTPTGSPPRRALTRRLAYGAGALCLGYAALSHWVDDFGFSESLRNGDLVAARSAMDRLAWLGRDGPSRHTEMGRRLAREGHPDEAREEFERSIALYPTTRAWESLGLLREQQRQWPGAASAYASALALSPDDASILFRTGRAWLEAGNPARAVPLLERAHTLAPEKKVIDTNLARARKESRTGG